MSYTLIQQFNAEHAHIKFNGKFHGKNVIWNTQFLTLNKYSEQEDIKNKNIKQFIHIEKSDTDILNLTVALNIEKINEPNIQKMMIMIRQYKNLAIGRHEYG